MTNWKYKINEIGHTRSSYEQNCQKIYLQERDVNLNTVTYIDEITPP